jgi:hypothetical protein
VRKAIVVILNQLNIKKIKSTKIILKKIIKKNHVGNTVAIHSVLKEKNYKAKFSTSLILKKIKSAKIILEKIIKKNHKTK